MRVESDRRMEDYCVECKHIKGEHGCFARYRRQVKHSEQMCSDMNNVLFSSGGRLRLTCKHIVLLYITLIFILFMQHTAHGFNIDVASKIEFPGPNPGSYFGYSVAMLNSGSQGKWMLFGAPKDNSSNLPHAARPGAIYKCTLFSNLRGQSCEELFVDNAEELDSANFNETTRIFIHGRDDQWLGATIDVERDVGIVTCASRWFNKYFQAEEYFFMNGLCYEIPLDFNRNNIRKIPALVDGKKQTITVGGGNSTKLNYGMGSLGVSAHYTKQGRDLLLGAPGLRTFTGGFIDLRQKAAYITGYDHPPTEVSEMAGYAMTSGRYFSNNVGPTYFAIGAPRENLTGQVYLFRADRQEFILEHADMMLNGSDVTEIPVNGFFGGALCSVDVNKDGLDDLLVAAPFYSMGSKQETGLVTVYLGTSNMKFEPMAAVLTGSDANGARFGSVIANAGDLNKDSYNDVIIGAPYEDDLQGAIYVYNGCKTGVWPEYSQRIPAAAIGPKIKSFGISLSKTEDMNDDGVNDIAVGAYLSDKAFLLFGQSVIRINISMETRITQIDKDSSDLCHSSDGSVLIPCFAINVCFRYSYRQVSSIEINVTVTLDTYMAELNRIAWQSNGASEQNFQLRLFTDDTVCIGESNIIIKSTTDLVTPVRIQATYDVVNIPTSGTGIKPTVNRFEGSNPNLQILSAVKILDFKKDCPNNDCRTDLHLSAEAEYDRADGYFILGTPTVAIVVSITKTGHPSYSSNVFVAFPKILQYQKVVTVSGDEEINCGFVAESADDKEADDINSLDYLRRQNIPSVAENEVLMVCSFGNPMSDDTGVRFKMILVVPEATNSTRLEIRLNATTLSTELQPVDNTKTLVLEVRNKVATTYSGISRPSYITMRDHAQKYLASHIYELRNKGPSPLPAANLLIQYPQIQKGGVPSLYLNTTTWSCTPPCRVICSFPDSANTAPVVYSANLGPTYLVDNTPNKVKIGEARTIKDMKNIDCQKGGCSRYECDLFDIPARESAVVTLEYVIAGDILEKTSGGDALRIRSESNVRLRELDRLITDATEPLLTSVDTELLPVSPPPQRLPWWIILVSVLAGIILIIIVVLILWKIGFFRRKQMEEMKKMQHQGELEKKLLDPEDTVEGEKPVKEKK